VYNLGMITLYHLKVYIGLDHRGQIVHGPTTHDCLQLMLIFFFHHVGCNFHSKITGFDRFLG